LDVFSGEPLTENHPLLNLNNVLLTPHAADLFKECIVGAAVEAAKAVVDVFINITSKHI
jgi:phosphoglycerate dehydrogenase-like enzyme